MFMSARSNFYLGLLIGCGVTGSLYGQDLFNLSPELSLISSRGEPPVEAKGVIPVKIIVAPRNVSQLILTRPTNIARFEAPATISIRATAIDPKGYISHVDFFARNVKIGESQIEFLVAPPPGTPVAHSFEWRNVPEGEYSISARATDTSGVNLTSGFALALVTQALPHVTVLATDPLALKSSTNTGTFTFYRAGGDPNQPLLISYGVGGTAVVNKDFVSLPGTAVIKARSNSVNLLVRALAQATTSEPDKTVELTIKPTKGYQIGSPSNAVVIIGDSRNHPNLPPKVELVSPLDETVFAGPTNITLEAEATDPDGWVQRVEFFEHTRRLGTVTNSATHLPRPGPISFTWSNASVGNNYILTAKATDNEGLATTSAPVKIIVASRNLSQLILTSPTNSARFEAPATISIRATAIDPKGYISHVDFYAQEVKIGESQIDFFVAPPAGTPVAHSFEWRNVPAGTYTISARATDTSGRNLMSARALILVTPGVPFVTVIATDPLALKSSDNTGTFTFYRAGGDANQPLLINYGIGGTAAVNQDFASLPATVMIPPRSNSVNLLVRALAQATTSEPDKTVVLTIKPNKGYQIGSPSHAVVIIGDKRNHPNLRPSVELVSPLDGTVFAGPTNIIIEAEATDPDGWVQRVEFFEHTRRLGTVTNNPAHLPPPARTMFTWTNASPGDNYILTAKASDNNGLSTTSAPAKIIVAPRNVSQLILTSPTNSARFGAPASISIRATAIDPKGYISHVDFYAQNVKIGESQISFLVAPPPGTPVAHAFEWRNVPEGAYIISARATDTSGRSLMSAPASILVTPGVPFVTVIATDPLALKSSDNTGTFTFYRTGGNTREPLRIDYGLSGTATANKDYASLPGSVMILSQANSVNVSVRALAQADAIEPDKTVALAIKTSQSYHIGAPSNAVVIIRDRRNQTNRPPIVTLVAPTNHAFFALPANIDLKAEASDPDGSVRMVSFFQGEHPLGTITNSPALQPANLFRFTWSNAPAGEYVLTARATDDAGARATSAPVSIQLMAPGNASFVERRLPDFYTPGVELTVTLKATPWTTIITYGIEDQPPAGWVVGKISNDGGYDPIFNQVKFGPYFDNQARTLTYTVTPPRSAGGVAHFNGIASADGRNSPISGQSLLSPSLVSYFPADVKPADFRLTLDEVTAYATAWRTSHTWPVGPNPIPMSYVTRAGAIWRSGENYVFDPTAGDPPLCWVAAMKPLMPMSHSAMATDTPLSIGNTVVWQLPAQDAPGKPLPVTLWVNPPAQTLAYAIEHQPPTGSSVVQINEGGHFDAASGKVKWVFFDSTPRSLAYQLTPVDHRTRPVPLIGAAVFSRVNSEVVVPIGSHNQAAITSATLASTHGCHAQARGDRVELAFSGDTGGAYVIESSDDLITWTTLDSSVCLGGEIHLVIPTADHTKHGFYRARRLMQ